MKDLDRAIELIGELLDGCTEHCKECVFANGSNCTLGAVWLSEMHRSLKRKKYAVKVTKAEVLKYKELERKIENALDYELYDENMDSEEIISELKRNEMLTGEEEWT